MQLPKLFSAIVIASSLLGAPLVASAEPRPVATQSTRTPQAPQAPQASVDDAKRYAQQELESPAAAKFEGGGSELYIGGSALTVVLVVLLIVILL